MALTVWRPNWLQNDRRRTDQMLTAGRFPTRHIDLPELYAQPCADESTAKPVCTYVVMALHVVVSVVLIAMQRFEFSDLRIGPHLAAQNCIGAQQSSVYSGEYWRLFTGIWLHSGIIQLTLTVVTLFRAGSDIEIEHGARVFMALYLLSSLAGAMMSVVFSYPNQTGFCGSGGMFGLLGSDVSYFIHNYYYLGGQRWRYLTVSLMLSLLGLILGLHPIMNNYAHIGGFVIGMLVSMAFLSQFQSVRGQPWLKYNRTTLALCCGSALLSILIFILLIVGISTRQMQFCSWCHYVDCAPLPWWKCPRPQDL